MGYAIRDDGQGWRACDGPESVLEYETYSESEPSLEIPVQVPQQVTMRQARLALLAADLLQSVEAAINAMPEPPQTAARIEWDYASEVHRASEFVGMLGGAIGLDEQALDDLFLKAVEL